jgi:hypothetical protein
MSILGMALAACLCGTQEKGQWVNISDSVTSKVEQKWPFLAAGIAVDPASGDVYLVISGAGLWKSTDHGKSFEQVDQGKVGGRCEAESPSSSSTAKPPGRATGGRPGTPAAMAAAGASTSSRSTGRTRKCAACGVFATRAARSAS